MYLKDKTLKKRYSIFPIIHNDLWQDYKKAEAQTWVAEEVDKFGIKLLGPGPVEHSFTVKIPVSQAVASQITEAGGTIENVA